ncbi:MAG TPA: hypothetical protein VFG76_12635 [Candidatus Polarisedimenticolia bacterium]|nr:hypothetical protein [Candidatus Polarisedimenticolia bacterium]
MSRRWLFALVLAAVAVGRPEAATPPSLVHYQGVLLNSSGQPLSGSFDVVLRLYTSASGNLVYTESHTTANNNAIVAVNGWFAVDLGTGTPQGGPLPLDFQFSNYAELWLEAQVTGQSALPRVRLTSAPYSMNSATLDGKTADKLINTSETEQAKAGPLAIGTTTPSSEGWGLEVHAPNTAAIFTADSGASEVRLANAGEGLSAKGEFSGGSFHLNDGYTSAVLASSSSGGTGLVATGDTVGGEFNTSGSSTKVASGGTGIAASGSTAGGWFEGNGSTTVLSSKGLGVFAAGSYRGGIFLNIQDSGQARLAEGDRGIWGKGLFAGGTFSHPDTLTHWADVSQIRGATTYKIRGTGQVSFVQNHPYEKDKVVVYAAPEGDEVAVYTRGTVRLSRGRATARLGSTFSLVANPDVGLTAHITPRGACPGLYVAAVSTSELEIRCDEPAGEGLVVDYLVYGLRIGFERHPPIQEKDREAFIPPREMAETFYTSHPRMKPDSALERHRSMSAAAGHPIVDFSRSEALASAVNEGREAALLKATEAASTALAASDPRTLADEPRLRIPPVLPSPSGKNSGPASQAPETRPRHPFTASLPLVTAPETGHVEAGDVLTIDPKIPGGLRVADRASDRGVAGCAVAPSEETPLRDGEVAVGVAGIYLCRVDARAGGIAVGDLLTSSATPGHAQRATAKDNGAILGKAMEPLPAGKGLIHVLVALR